MMDVRLVLRGDLPGDDHMILFDEGLHRHTAVPVALQAVRDDGVRNLIAYLVRVPGGHLLTGEHHVHGLIPGSR